jgi:hypothetical protein
MTGVLREQILIPTSQSGGLSRLSRYVLRRKARTLLLRMAILKDREEPASVRSRFDLQCHGF